MKVLGQENARRGVESGRSSEGGSSASGVEASGQQEASEDVFRASSDSVFLDYQRAQVETPRVSPEEKAKLEETIGSDRARELDNIAEDLADQAGPGGEPREAAEDLMDHLDDLNQAERDYLLAELAENHAVALGNILGEMTEEERDELLSLLDVSRLAIELFSRILLWQVQVVNSIQPAGTFVEGMGTIDDNDAYYSEEQSLEQEITEVVILADGSAEIRPSLGSRASGTNLVMDPQSRREEVPDEPST